MYNADALEVRETRCSGRENVPGFSTEAGNVFSSGAPSFTHFQGVCVVHFLCSSQRYTSLSLKPPSRCHCCWIVLSPRASLAWYALRCLICLKLEVSQCTTLCSRCQY